jgi:hypothetical protein
VVSKALNFPQNYSDFVIPSPNRLGSGCLSLILSLNGLITHIGTSRMNSDKGSRIIGCAFFFWRIKSPPRNKSQS